MKRFLNDESGATAIEYGLILALIVTVMVVGLAQLGGNTAGSWGSTAKRVTDVMP